MIQILDDWGTKEDFTKKIITDGDKRVRVDDKISS